MIAAILYAVIASARWPISGGNLCRLRKAAIRRKQNIAMRSHASARTAKSIALLGGEEEERAGLERSFGAVLKQWACSPDNICEPRSCRRDLA